jgi:hypothetical protein
VGTQILKWNIPKAEHNVANIKQIKNAVKPKPIKIKQITVTLMNIVNLQTLCDHTENL